MDIRQILDGVRKMGFVMPEFQREYVWRLEDAKQLMVSLFRNYPTGSLLFWKTNAENAPEIKNNAIENDKIGEINVILDGQQRITTLFLLIRGEIPPYYTEEDIMNDPRHLYFNVFTGSFQYYSKSMMEGSVLWQKVINCFDEQKTSAISLASSYKKEKEDIDFEKVAGIINNNLNALRDIQKRDYPIQTVPSDAHIDEAIDVFDRVNSQGTKLTDAELVLTHITGKWAHARRTFKEKIQQLEKCEFILSLDFLTRLMVVELTGSALLNRNAKLDYGVFTQNDYVKAWEKVSKALDYLIPILQHEGLITSSDDMSTMNVLTPIVAYLLKHDLHFSASMKYGFLYWMFLALMWARYSGQTEQRLDRDVSIVLTSASIIEELEEQIIDMRGRKDVKPTDLEGRSAGHPFYRMLYIITKHNKGIDWANGSPIHGTIGDYYSIQSHHIFPQALLYRTGYNSENHLDKKKVNEIANRAFITRDTNFSISDTAPFEYLPGIENKYPGALKKQYIPNNQELWKIEKFEEFLQARRALISDAINSFIQQLKEKSVNGGGNDTPNWQDIIAKGEDNFIEFKSSIRWDYKQEQVNKVLEFVIAKTLAALLNTEGGRLFIGIDDEGNILGLENDYSTLGNKGNWDGFQLKLIEIINNLLGKEFHQNLSVQLVQIEGKDVCVIEVSANHTPVYVRYNNQEHFFIRASSSTQPMSIREANEYISNHWNK
ncbi:MAG: DUF262 domain-containing protein [bacterium]